MSIQDPVRLFFDLVRLIIESGVLVYLFKINYKWNTVLDRLDLLYKQYCDDHQIPFKGLKNDFD